MTNEPEEICDFCGGRSPKWTYAVRQGEKTRHWAACRTCHRLVEESGWGRLAVRVARAYTLCPHPRVLVDAMWVVLRDFRDARTGAARELRR